MGAGKGYDCVGHPVTLPWVRRSVYQFPRSNLGLLVSHYTLFPGKKGKLFLDRMRSQCLPAGSGTHLSIGITRSPSHL